MPFQSDTACTRLCPATGAKADVEGVDQPAVDLVGQNDRDDKFRDSRPLGLRDGKTGRDIIARMTGDAPDIGVVQVEITERGAIGECRKIGRDTPLGADDRRAAAAARQHHIAANAHRLFVERRKTATERVDQLGFDTLDSRVVEIVIA